MSAAQQRTRNRRRVDPGQQPLPVFLAAPLVSLTTGGEITLQYFDPVRLMGLPLITKEDGTPADSAVQTDDVTLTIGWAVPPVAGEQITIPDWTPAIRGLNGEWTAGGVIRPGTGGARDFPVLVVVLGGTAGAGDTVTYELSEIWTAESADSFAIGGLGVLSFDQPTESSVRVVYDSTPTAGMTFTVGPWLPTNYAALEGIWLAPQVGTVE